MTDKEDVMVHKHTKDGLGNGSHLCLSPDRQKFPNCCSDSWAKVTCQNCLRASRRMGKKK